MNALKATLLDLVDELPEDQVAGAIDDLQRRAKRVAHVSDPDYINTVLERESVGSDEITISPVSGFPNVTIGRRVTPEFVAEMIDE